MSAKDTSDTSASRPNLLLITTDQQRYDTIRPFRPDFLRTPHLDMLADQGVTFTRAYADCPLCVPSRISIMTGQSAFAHGMAHNGSTTEVMGRDETLPARLRRLGYQTAAIGKMHFTPQRARHGFDEMILPEDYYRQMRTQGHAALPMRHGIGQNELYPTLATVPEAQTLTNWTVDQCVEYLLQRRDPTAPFFLWCSFSKPHPPFDPPEPYYSMYKDSPIPEPVVGDWASDDQAPPRFRQERQLRSYDRLNSEVIRAARAAYYGLITQIDYNIGRLWAALGETGQEKDTLILFASDHGEYLGDHHAGAKRYFHEPSAHIPMIMRLPPSWREGSPGAHDDSLVSLPDILPTFVRAAGGEADDVEGRDLIALRRGEQPPRDTLEAVADTTDACLSLGITDGRWKYLWFTEGPSEQLFDLQTDPQETHDLAGDAQYDDQRQRMHDLLVQRLKARGDWRVKDGELVTQPMNELSEAEVRAKGGLGLHTEYLDKDVRH